MGSLARICQERVIPSFMVLCKGVINFVINIKMLIALLILFSGECFWVLLFFFFFCEVKRIKNVSLLAAKHFQDELLVLQQYVCLPFINALHWNPWDYRIKTVHTFLPFAFAQYLTTFINSSRSNNPMNDVSIVPAPKHVNIFFFLLIFFQHLQGQFVFEVLLCFLDFVFVLVDLLRHVPQILNGLPGVQSGVFDPRHKVLQVASQVVALGKNLRNSG